MSKSRTGILPAVAMLVLAVLLDFYFHHYFALENTVRRWYIIEDELRFEMKSTQSFFDL